MENFVIGQKYWTNGLDMECRKVRVQVELVRILNKLEIDTYAGRYDCVTINSDGIKVLGKLSNLSTVK